MITVFPRQLVLHTNVSLKPTPTQNRWLHNKSQLGSAHNFGVSAVVMLAS